jgi:acylphosphatase
MSASETRRILVSGRVQGVGYRAWLQREALRLGLGGIVRNLKDGRVEAIVTGPPDAVAALCEACSRGPHNARVSGLDITFADAAAPLPGERFSVVGTV